MSKVIELENIEKTFKVLNRREGLVGTFKDLFSRNYSYVSAVDHISFSIEEGEIVGCLGPNGAGKSTTIKMMTGVLEPSSGNIIVNGKNPYKQRIHLAQEIGVVFGQRSQLWWSLPAIESFKILKQIYRINDTTYKRNLELYESLVDVEKLYKKPIRQMSLGQRTLCDILASFLHDPKVVFLDEPTIGLDVSMKAKIRKLISILNQEKKTTVILTTHDMGDVDALCKRTMIIDHGKLIFDDTYDELKNIFGEERNLKISVTEEVRQNVKNELMQIYSTDNAITVQEVEQWLDIHVDESKVKSIDIIGNIMSKYQVNDLKIEEVSAESIVRKIYEGGN